MTGATRESQEGLRSRPIGVTILAALAGIAMVLAVVHLFQALGVLPYFIGPIGIRSFNIWYVLLWGLMIWVWWWAFQALLAVDQSAWFFLLIVSGFNLIFDFFTMISVSQAYTDLSVSFVVNFVVFAYTLLPGTRRAFGVY